MAGTEYDQGAPIWAAAKARKQIDVVREAAKALAEVERERANRPIEKMTESDLEAEQLRLEERLHAGSLTVEEYCRLRDVDAFLDGMRERRDQGPSREGWRHEYLQE